MSHIKNVAIIGGSGNIGQFAVKHLLLKGFNVTAVSREDSSATFPDKVKIVKGNYHDSAFLRSAFKGHDALIISLSISSKPDIQSLMIQAACEVGVRYILPNEFGSDNNNKRLGIEFQPGLMKLPFRHQIEQQGSSYIAVICGLWYDYCMRISAWGVDVKNRTAGFYGDGTIKCSTSTLEQAGKAIAHILSLPETSSSGRSLADYKNKFVYIRSFEASQRDILNAVQKATGTTDADWKISNRPIEETIATGRDKSAKGDYWGMVDVLLGLQFAEGSHGNFADVADNEVLDLPLEDLDKVTAQLVKEIEGQA